MDTNKITIILQEEKFNNILEPEKIFFENQDRYILLNARTPYGSERSVLYDRKTDTFWKDEITREDMETLYGWRINLLQRD